MNPNIAAGREVFPVKNSNSNMPHNSENQQPEKEIISPAKKKELSLERAWELKKRIEDYRQQLPEIKKGREMKKIFVTRREKILRHFAATLEDWNSWKWQIKNRISTVEELKNFVELSSEELQEIKAVEEKYRWSISPYFLSLINPKDKSCPIRKQSIPQVRELEANGGEPDPMNEELTNPAGVITRRYPDRLIIKLTNICGMFCRHCQRRREIGEVDQHVDSQIIEESIQYIRDNEEIRDVLLTGGDPLTLETGSLEEVIRKLRSIPHVEIIRIGSRMPVTVPQRVTENLCDMLAEYHPIYLNTQVNHPKELTEEVFAACKLLSRAGIPLGNQAVLLRGINNDPHVMKCLNQELLQARIKPYYIFHAKQVIGTSHFQTSVDDGIEIMEKLRGYTSGMAIPQYIINAPGGLGKTPVSPEYVISRGRDHVTIRTWENKVINYPNHR